MKKAASMVFGGAPGTAATVGDRLLAHPLPTVWAHHIDVVLFLRFPQRELGPLERVVAVATANTSLAGGGASEAGHHLGVVCGVVDESDRSRDDLGLPCCQAVRREVGLNWLCVVPPVRKVLHALATRFCARTLTCVCCFYFSVPPLGATSTSRAFGLNAKHQHCLITYPPGGGLASCPCPPRSSRSLSRCCAPFECPARNRGFRSRSSSPGRALGCTR